MFNKNQVDYYGIWTKKVTERKKQISKVVRDIHEGMDSVLSDSPLAEMLYEVKPRSDEGIAIGAVDGGEGLQELSGIAVYMVRASGFIKPKNGSCGKSRFIRDLDLGAIPIDKQTKARVQFMRATMEYSVAAMILAESKPDYLLIDGSLLVGAEVDPIKTEEYNKYVAALKNLMDDAHDLGVRLVGVSEDSTSRGLIGYLGEKGLSGKVSKAMSALTDASLVQLYTQRLDEFVPTATNPFLPVSNKGREWIKKNTGIDKSFPTFYLQATKFGRAMRVDFPSDGKKIGRDAREAAELLTYLSQIPKRYGYPLPLFLAHSDAELPRKLMERTAVLIQKEIFRNYSDEYLSLYSKKRRDSRPGSLE